MSIHSYDTSAFDKPAENMKRGALYTRVSTKKGERYGGSLENQDKACRVYAHLKNVRLDYEINEGGDSGFKWKRSGLERLRSLVRSGKIDAVVCYEPFRLARGEDLPGLLQREMAAHGVVWLCVVDEPVDSDVGRLMLTITSHVTSWDVRKRRNQMKETWHNILENGAWVQKGRAPFGYKIEKRPSEKHPTGMAVFRVADEETAKWVRAMFQWRDEGKSATWIAKKLTEENVPRPGQNRTTNRTWCVATVIDMLRSPLYKGVTYGKMMVTIGEGDDRKQIRRDRDDEEGWIEVPGATEAIVSEELWERVQHVQRAPKKNRFDPENPTYPLTGSLICACGRHMSGMKGSQNRYWCNAGRKDQKEKCGYPSIKAWWIEEIVWNWVIERMSDPDMVARAIREREQRELETDTARDLASLKEDLAALTPKVRKAYEMKRDATEGSIEYEFACHDLEQLRHEEERLKKGIAYLESQQQRAAMTPAQKRTVEECCRDVVAKAATYGTAKKYEVYRAIGLKVTMDEDGTGILMEADLGQWCAKESLPHSSLNHTPFLPISHYAPFPSDGRSRKDA